MLQVLLTSLTLYSASQPTHKMTFSERPAVGQRTLCRHKIEHNRLLKALGIMRHNSSSQPSSISVSVVHSSYYQNLEAVIQSFSQGNAIIQHQWKTNAFSCIKPGIDYSNDKFGSDSSISTECSQS